MLIITLFNFFNSSCLKNNGFPNATVPEYIISRNFYFFSAPYSVNHVVVLPYVSNTVLNWYGDLQCRRTGDYSRKPGSTVTTQLTVTRKIKCSWQHIAIIYEVHLRTSPH